MEAYMTVMACFIDADWKMNSVVLEKKAYHIPPEKRVSMVTDNTANMVLSVELLKGVARRGVG